MIFNSVKRSEVFNEFSDEEKEYWFDLKGKKTLHHIDTFYYSVRLREERVFEGEMEAPEILKFIRTLDDLKQEKSRNLIKDVTFYGLTVELKTFSGTYQYCISENLMYDIFIARTLINDETPRIVVQLRTQLLVERGVNGAVYLSYGKLLSILEAFDLKVDEIRNNVFPINENRIDYSWHSNLIQDVSFFMSDEYLRKHLKSRMRNGMKHFDPSTFEYNYLACGDRRSNNLFFRVYDKTKEVIEEGYKGFFLERWLENGLISRYDHYCLNRAYEMQSYTVGVLVGRIEWYLEFGKDETKKQFLRKVLGKYFISTTNSKYIRQYIGGKKIRISCDEFAKSCQAHRFNVDGNPEGDAFGDNEDELLSDTVPCGVTLGCMLPPTTTVLNFEYQTKRHFYRTLDQMICGMSLEAESPELTRIARVLALHKPICEYLTSYSGAVCFVRDRNAKLKKGQLEESPETVYTDFWHLLRNTKIQIESDEQLFRSYKRKADLERAKRKLLSCIAMVSMLLAKNVDFETTFSKDAVDVLASVNDNDAVKSFKLSSENGEDVILRNMKYDQIRDRRKHTLKNVVEVPEEENPGEV